MKGESPRSLDELRATVADLVDRSADSLGDDQDLIGQGVDSIRIMRVANALRRGGLDVRFADLIERPTLSAWWALTADRTTPAAEPTAQAAGPTVPGATPTPQKAEPTPQKAEPTGPFELAPMQQAYWVGRADEQVLGGVSAHYYTEFDGFGVAPQGLEAAVRALLRRHGMLRARFNPDGRQQILPESSWPGLTVYDLRADPDPAAQLDRVRREESARRLAVDRGEVFDVRLSLLPGGATRIHVNIDMLVCDAQSFQIILAELAARYRDPEVELASIDTTFPRYLAELAQRRSAAHERAQAYWRQAVAQLPGPPQLPLAIEPERVGERGIGRRYHQVDRALKARLAERSARRGLTVAAAVATAFAEVLAAWSGEPRFLLNLPLFDRDLSGAEVGGLVGDFTNLVVLAVDLSAAVPFTEQARRLQAQLRSDISHAEYSGLEVLRDVARLRPGQPMAAPVVFTSAIGLGELFGPQVRECLGTPVWTSSQTPQVWLDHQVIEQDGGLLLNWDVVEELFPAGVVDAMFAAYLDLVGRLTADGTEQAWDEPVPALVPPAAAAVRARVNDTAGAVARLPLHAPFFARAAAEPDRVALLGSGGPVSYGELAARALSIAHRLRTGGSAGLPTGLRTGDLVAVTLPRGPDQVAAVLGVLAAGGTYVPVGVDCPPARRQQIYADAGVVGVLDAPALAVDTGAPEAGALATPVPVGLEALAYVIYTSGSTGVPKGVEITHAAAANTVEDLNARFGIGPDDRVLAVSALDFDLSVYDIFGLLGAGGAVVLVGEADRREARRWAALVAEHRVTVWNSVPALLDMLVSAADGADLSSLRLVMVSGDWVAPTLPGRLAAAGIPRPAAGPNGRPGTVPDDGPAAGLNDRPAVARNGPARFVALGGATEAAIWSNAYEVAEASAHWRSVPYGYPLRNQRFRVVDPRGRDCPDWVAGELWIGGAGVARGYRGDPERTARQFVDHGGLRWYRTGDVGRYWPDGTLEFLGRRDHQVKIRGHRIELGEIEAALLAQPEVAAAIATVDDGRLAAAVLIRPGETVGEAVGEAGRGEALRTALADRLPSYMVPAGVLVLDQFPLTANGKVDRAALAGLVAASDPTEAPQPPTGELESALAELWAKLLGIGLVGRRESFFALGGDSLVATRMVEELRRRFGAEVPLREFFAGPTVAELAAVVAGQVDAGVPQEEGAI